MSRVLEGRNVLVVGAGGGIGRAVALAAAKEGANIVVADRGVPHRGGIGTSELARAVVEQVRAAGSDAVAVTDSVTSVTGAAAMVQAALDRWGHLDGAVCCQAIQSDALLVDYAEDEWGDLIATHLTGHFTVYQAAARAMIKQGAGGSIVGFGSGYVQGTAQRSAYRAAKAGIVALTKSAAVELTDHRVRVNCVAPAANTRMTEAAGVVADGTPDDVAPLVVYLLSDLTADITGEIVSIAGDRIAGWRDPFQDRLATRDTRWTLPSLAREVPFVLGRERVGTPVAAPRS